METLKKSYSEFNILQERMTGSAKEKGLLQYLFTNRKYVTITIPYYQYLRGLIFIDDLRDNYPDTVSYNYSMADLLHMLYSDFLNQVKRGVSNEEVAAYLKQSMATYFPIKMVEKRVFKEISSTLFKFEEVEEEYEEIDEEKYAYLDIRMREKIILRGEVLIHDLSPYMDGVRATVEQLVAIIYLDFIKQIQEKGNSTAVQNAIVGKINRDSE
jgi:hypothetical protein